MNLKNVLDKGGVESDPSYPLGFVHFKSQRQCDSVSSSSSKTHKCLTSFANHKNKNIRGISFLHEMSRMIEVENMLGYDVKGC